MAYRCFKFCAPISHLFQGLYEYVRPCWEARPRPADVDLDLKTFGATLPARPTLGNDTDQDKNVPQ